MPNECDISAWSGEGAFTQQLINWFTEQETIAFLKVEDAKSARADVEYNFISNEIFLQFHTVKKTKKQSLWGVLSFNRTIFDKLMTIEELHVLLENQQEIGSVDYADADMIQFLRTERIVPPYQTKGYKLIELVRIYEFGATSRT